MSHRQEDLVEVVVEHNFVVCHHSLATAAVADQVDIDSVEMSLVERQSLGIAEMEK